MGTVIAWNEMPTLTTGRLALRQVRDEDAAAVLDVFGDPEVVRYWSSPPLENLADAQALIRQIHGLFRAKTLFQWGIALRSTDVLAGTCTLLHLDLEHRRGEIGFALGQRHWGQGIAREAVERVIQLAFDELDLQRLEADVDPRNERSLRLLERQGFLREGLLRERYHVGGETQDTMLLGLLRREWKGRVVAISK
jgi:RimJ/RimL family protein N-acetyltransferase